MLWKNEEERDKLREEWLKGCLDHHEDFKKQKRIFQTFFHEEEEEPEERNDVYIYKRLLYPPKSIPPTSN